MMEQDASNMVEELNALMTELEVVEEMAYQLRGRIAAMRSRLAETTRH